MSDFFKIIKSLFLDTPHDPVVSHQHYGKIDEKFLHTGESSNSGLSLDIDMYFDADENQEELNELADVFINVQSGEEETLFDTDLDINTGASTNH